MTPEELAVPFDYETIRSKVRGAFGTMVTVGLFEEYARTTTPFFSLKDWRKRYIAIADPTEYAAAMHLLGDWEHWQVLRENAVLKKEIDRWQREVEIKLRSQGILSSIRLADSAAPGAAGAARWLAEGGFVADKRLNTKEGRQKEEAARKEARDRADADLERMSGGKGS